MRVEWDALLQNYILCIFKLLVHHTYIVHTSILYIYAYVAQKVRHGLPIGKKRNIKRRNTRTIHFTRSAYTHIQHKRNTWYISAMESHRFGRFQWFKVKVYAVRCVLALSGKTPKIINRLQKTKETIIIVSIFLFSDFKDSVFRKIQF